MAGNDLADAFYKIPPVTRWWFSATIVLSLIGKLGLLDPYSLILLWEPFFYKLQLWRPITSLFFYPISPQTGFHFLITLYFLYSYSSALETNVFSGRQAEYVFMLLVNWTALTCIGLLMNTYLIFEPMVLSVLYVWSQLNRETIVQFWFGTQFKAIYFPWALVVLNLIIRGSAAMELIGILVGHIYYFFVHQYPTEYGGRQFLTTPAFLYRMFPGDRAGFSGFGVPPPRATRNDVNNNRSRGFPGPGRNLND